MVEEAPYLSIAQRKRAQRASSIPPSWILPPSALPSPLPLNLLSLPLTSGFLTPLEIAITSTHDVVSLSSLIRARTLTSETIVTAFCKRAALAQQLCNCLTEILFSSAISRAKLLDDEYTRTGKLRSPLHGIPISLKDTFKIKGYDSSIGIASLAEKPAEENSLLVDILLEKGAVLYCKTNVPQTLMALDSDNNVFGRVLNPRNTRLTSGGSSGGEGALIAMRGSVLGVGTDIGGSIRIPAMCNGLYGIKPSSQRVPYVGQESAALPGASKLGISASAGPLATSLRDCELFLQAISDSSPWERDPFISFAPWSSQGSLSSKPLIGILYTDGITTPLPPITSLLTSVHQTLQSSTIDTLEITSPALKKCQSLANSFFSIDGYSHIFSLLSTTSEPLIPWLSTRLRPKPPISLENLRELQAKKTELETEMLKIWRCPKTGRTVDAIICPVAPHPVPPVDRWNGVGYTSSWVLMDYPAGTLPVRDVVEGDLAGEVDESSPPLSNWDKANRELWGSKTIDRSVYLNSKLSIQVIAPKQQERRLAEAMSLIDGILNKRKKEEGNEKAKL